MLSIEHVPEMFGHPEGVYWDAKEIAFNLKPSALALCVGSIRSKGAYLKGK